MKKQVFFWCVVFMVTLFFGGCRPQAEMAGGALSGDARNTQTQTETAENEKREKTEPAEAQIPEKETADPAKPSGQDEEEYSLEKAREIWDSIKDKFPKDSEGSDARYVYCCENNIKMFDLISKDNFLYYYRNGTASDNQLIVALLPKYSGDKKFDFSFVEPQNTKWSSQSHGSDNYKLTFDFHDTERLWNKMRILEERKEVLFVFYDAIIRNN